MSEPSLVPPSADAITETSLTQAIVSVVGQTTFDALSENSGFTAAHDRACMVAFMDDLRGPEIEILRVARRFISQKGRYPYYPAPVAARSV